MGGTHHGSPEPPCGYFFHYLGSSHHPFQPQAPLYERAAFPCHCHSADGVCFQSPYTFFTPRRTGDSGRYFYGRPDHCFFFHIQGMGIEGHRFVSKLDDTWTIDWSSHRRPGRINMGLQKCLRKCVGLDLCDSGVLLLLRG